VIKLGRNLVSIDLGSQNIHLVSGRYNKGSIEVRKAALKHLPEGIFKDGKIEDFRTLKETIKNTIAENKIKDKNTVLTIQSTSVITRDLTLPTVKHEELGNMVKYEIEQYLPIVSTEYIIEYTLLDEVEEGGIKQSRIQVAAMPKNMVENYLNLVKEAGLKPAALDIHSNAVAKLFSNTMAINRDTYTLDKTIAFIDMGYRSIIIHILSKGKPAFSRIITLGAREIDSEISISCNLTLEQAEARKIKETDLDSRQYVGSSSEELLDIVRSQLDIWLSEIQKIFQYYISRSTGNRIDGIYLFGGSSKLRGLPRYVEQALNIRTSKIERLGLIKTGKDIQDFNHGDYINALGGLIRYE
jgi:type IV pilus assembly protein PilM